MKLSKSRIIEALQKLNEEAKEHGVCLEICIYGGAAFLLAYDSRNITKDVDVIIRPREEGLKIAKKVARKLGIHEDWINDDVRQFIGYRENKRPLSQFSDLSHLKITVPVAGYLLAMKSLACRDPLPGYEGDWQDLKFLIKKMEISSVSEIQDRIDQYYADDVLSEKSIRKLEQLINEVNKAEG